MPAVANTSPAVLIARLADIGDHLATPDLLLDPLGVSAV